MPTVESGRVVGGRILGIALISSVILTAGAGRAYGDPRTFVGADGGAWTVNSNWSPAGPLTADDDLVFPSGGAVSSVNDYPGTRTVRSISFEGAHGVTGGFIELTGSVTVDATVTASLTSGITLLTFQTWAIGSGAQLTLGGTITIGVGSGQWTVDAASTSTVTVSTIGGVGEIVKEGGGVLRITGTNSFAGPVTINGGQIAVAASGALGNSDGTPANATTVNQGGMLVVDGPNVLGEALILNGNGNVSLRSQSMTGTLSVTAPVTLTSRSAVVAVGAPRAINFLDTVAGPGALDIRDATDVSLFAGGNTFSALYFSGTFQSVLQAQAVDAIPLNLAVDLPMDTVLALNGLDAQLSSLTGDGVVNTGTSPTSVLTFSVAAATTQVLNTQIVGKGRLAKTGEGELVIGNANGFEGYTLVLQGRLRITHPEALGPANPSSNVATRVRGNATFTVDGVSPVTKYIMLERLAPTETPILEITGAAPVTFSYPVEMGPGAIIRGSGGATVTMGNRLGMSGPATLENVAVHLATAQNTLGDTLTIGAGATLHADVADAISFGARMVIAGTGTLALNGRAVSLDSLTGTGTASLGTNGTLTLRGAGVYTFAGTITGSGTLEKVASANVTLSGQTPFTGSVKVTGGPLIVAHAMTLANHAISVHSGGTLIYDVAANPTGAITLSGYGPTNSTESLYVRGGNVTLSGAVTADGQPTTRLRVDAPHTLTFQAPIAGNHLFTHGSGTTVIGSAGNTLQNLDVGSEPTPAPTGTIVRVNVPDAFAPTLRLRVFTDATYDLNGFTQTVGQLFGNGRVALGSGTLTLVRTVSTSFDGTFSGTGAFVANVPSLALKNTHTLTGSITVNGGFTLDGTLPAAVTVNTAGFNGAVLRPGAVVGPITVNGTNLLMVGDQATPGGVTTGGLTLASTSGLWAWMHGSGVPLTVNGPVSVAGRFLIAPANGATLSRGTPLTVIANDNADAIAGTFTDLSEGGNVPTSVGIFTASYAGGTGNDMTLLMPRPGYHLSEGATGPFFDTELLIANPNDQSVTIDVTLLPEEGEPVTLPYTLSPLSRLTILVDDIPGFEHASFSTVVRPTTDAPLVVERTMRWDARGYGAHTEKATLVEGMSGFLGLFAEGAEGFFRTFLLLQNPHSTKIFALVTYMRENEEPVERLHELEPASRKTIIAADDPDLVDRSFGIAVQFSLPAMAERAMYFGDDPIWTGGHASAGASQPSTTWFLAEGATGGIFSTFILVANPQMDPVDVTYTFLTEGGTPATLTRTIGPFGRLTINPAAEDLGIPPGPVATQITATKPVIAERSQYWSTTGGAWNESHNSLGVIEAATKWGLAEGRSGGPEGYSTYILLANAGTAPANVTLKFLGDGVTAAPAEQTIAVGGQQRVTVRVDPADPGAAGATTFGTVITSDNPIVVERAMYWNAAGQFWSAGTNATATRLP